MSRADRARGARFGAKLSTGIDDSRAQRHVVKCAHHRQRAVGPLTPIVVAERHTCIVETNPRASDQLRMHQDEPAIGVALRRARLAGYVGANPEACSDVRAGAPVDDVAHHVDERLRCAGR